MFEISLMNESADTLTLCSKHTKRSELNLELNGYSGCLLVFPVVH